MAVKKLSCLTDCEQVKMAASPGRPLSGTRDVMPRGSDADESGDDPAEAEAREQLERRNKALDSARRGYMEESNRIISKQQDAIERLKEENRRLKSELDAGTKVWCPMSSSPAARSIVACTTRLSCLVGSCSLACPLVSHALLPGRDDAALGDGVRSSRSAQGSCGELQPKGAEWRSPPPGPGQGWPVLGLAPPSPQLPAAYFAHLSAVRSLSYLQRRRCSWISSSAKWRIRTRTLRWQRRRCDFLSSHSIRQRLQ